MESMGIWVRDMLARVVCSESGVGLREAIFGQRLVKDSWRMVERNVASSAFRSFDSRSFQASFNASVRILFSVATVFTYPFTFFFN